METTTTIIQPIDPTVYIPPYPESRREFVALECLKVMLTVPGYENKSFDMIADFAFRQADAFLAKSKEPQI